MMNLAGPGSRFTMSTFLWTDRLHLAGRKHLGDLNPADRRARPHIRLLTASPRQRGTWNSGERAGCGGEHLAADGLARSRDAERVCGGMTMPIEPAVLTCMTSRWCVRDARCHARRSDQGAVPGRWWSMDAFDFHCYRGRCGGRVYRAAARCRMVQTRPIGRPAGRDLDRVPGGTFQIASSFRLRKPL